MTRSSPQLSFQRPSFLFSSLILFAVIVFFSLGVWQVQRLSWKENLIDTIEKNAFLPSVNFLDVANTTNLPTPISSRAIVPSEFRSVTLTGTFQQEKFIFLVERSPNGAPGVHVFMAFQPHEKPSETTEEEKPSILINRGWIPFDVRKHGGWQALLQDERVVNFTGKIRFYRNLSWLRGLVLPKNTPETNTFFQLDIPAIEKKLQIPLNPKIYLSEELSTASKRIYPIAGPWIRNIPNNHMLYAITWFSLAIVLISMWFFYGLHLARNLQKYDN